jgi:hypothetical protein
MSALAGMARPWYRGPIPGYGDHLYADCPRLADEGGPREGLGWLDPYDHSVCAYCFTRHDPAESARRVAVACEH